MTLRQALTGFFAARARLAELDVSPPSGVAAKRAWVSEAASANVALISSQQQLLAAAVRAAANVMKGRSAQGWVAVDIASWALARFLEPDRSLPPGVPADAWIRTAITRKYIGLYRRDRRPLPGSSEPVDPAAGYLWGPRREGQTLPEPDEAGADAMLTVTRPEKGVTPDDMERMLKAMDLLHAMIRARTKIRDLDRMRYAFEQHSFWERSAVEIVADPDSRYSCERKPEDVLKLEDDKDVEKLQNLVRQHAGRYAAELQSLLSTGAGELPRDLRNLLAERIASELSRQAGRKRPSRSKDTEETSS